MADIFEMFDVTEQSVTTKAIAIPNGVADEIKKIALAYDVTLSDELAKELSLYYIDPPPWAPWK